MHSFCASHFFCIYTRPAYAYIIIKALEGALLFIMGVRTAVVNFGKWVVKHRRLILIVSILLLIPSVIGMVCTRVNYDMLSYLPDDIETVRGQNILLEDFGKGGFSMVLVEGMEPNEVVRLKESFEDVEHVESVIWYDSVMDVTVPMELLPEKFYDAFNSGDTTMMAIFFDSSVSADETMDAISQLRSLAGKQCFVSGMSAFVTDLRDIAENEEPIYVAIAVALASLVLAVFMDSFLLPLLFLASIGMAILYNLGSNFFLGEISYITKALSAVLQLGVTMDYSIFLWHSYKEQKERFEGDNRSAMAHAVADTVSSVVSSSVTTVAGFLALCFMSYKLGMDLGIVMAKGVVFGVISCVTVLPALLLACDRAIEKTSHRVFMPDFKLLSGFVTSKYAFFAALFLVLLVPSYYGYKNAKVYYKLDESMPKDLECVIANEKLQDKFDMNSTHMLLVDSKLEPKQAQAMLKEINAVDGVKFTLGADSLIGSAVAQEILPDSALKMLKSDKYQLMLISSQYKVASDEVNAQVDVINGIVKKYDPNGMLIGEAPCTKDLITITDRDFAVVNVISIAAIFIIIAFALKSFSLPVILVCVIELAIFINLGIPFYTNTELPFIASICISTIQLGATVDYAILMTNRYKKERADGSDKKSSVQTALRASAPSILVSALGFFAATFGVGLYSDIDMIGALCNLMARGAIVSMLCVILILPAMFMALDKLICATTFGLGKSE